MVSPHADGARALDVGRVVVDEQAIRRRQPMPGTKQFVNSAIGLQQALMGRDDDALKAEVDVIKSENPDCRAVCPLLFSPPQLFRGAASGCGSF